MKKFRFYSAIFILACIIHSKLAHAQSADEISTKHNSSDLFSNEKILHLKLAANFRSVQKDRSDDPSYHAALLSYKNDDSIQISIPVKIKARGNFRKDRNNCIFPPLLLNFPKHHADSAGLFMNQEKLKLVTHCQGDQYVIREWLVYKLYNLLT